MRNRKLLRVTILPLRSVYMLKTLNGLSVWAAVAYFLTLCLLLCFLPRMGLWLCTQCDGDSTSELCGLLETATYAPPSLRSKSGWKATSWCRRLRRNDLTGRYVKKSIHSPLSLFTVCHVATSSFNLFCIYFMWRTNTDQRCVLYVLGCLIKSPRVNCTNISCRFFNRCFANLV